MPKTLGGFRCGRMAVSVENVFKCVVEFHYYDITFSHNIHQQKCFCHLTVQFLVGVVITEYLECVLERAFVNILIAHHGQRNLLLVTIPDDEEDETGASLE
jgi:hypothetical protein